MYQETELTKKNALIFVPPASLVVGSIRETTDYTIRLMQSVLCLSGGCKTCSSCQAIAQQNHYQLVWISPEQRYTLDMIEPITHIATLALEENSHFFFVLSHADMLSDSCANKLLKLVEEPPAGYHFIFITARPEDLLPTIRSRCVMTCLENNDTSFKNHPLYPFFTVTNHDNPLLFLKTLEQSKITEQECLQFIDILLIFWNDFYKKTLNTPEQKKAYAVLELLNHQATIPPMAGSAKLFLKNLYLTHHSLMHKKVL